MTTEADKISPNEMIKIAEINKFFEQSKYLRRISNHVYDGSIELVANSDVTSKLIYYARNGAMIISIPEHELGKLGATGYKSVLAKILNNYVEEKNWCQLTQGPESGCFGTAIGSLFLLPTFLTVMDAVYRYSNPNNNIAEYSVVAAFCLAVVAMFRGFNKSSKNDDEKEYNGAINYLKSLQTIEFEEDGKKLSWVQKTTADKLFDEVIKCNSEEEFVQRYKQGCYEKLPNQQGMSLA